jgi:LysR family glycine cleavage system transcriptional activator
LLHISPRPTAWADWFRTQGETLPANAASSEFGHFFMAMDAARAVQGVALAPTLLLRGPGGSGLVEPIKSNVPSAGAYYLLCRQKDAADARLGRLIAWLQVQATVPLHRPRKGTPQSASPSASQ